MWLARILRDSIPNGAAQPAKNIKLLNNIFNVIDLF